MHRQTELLTLLTVTWLLLTGRLTIGVEQSWGPSSSSSTTGVTGKVEPSEERLGETGLLKTGIHKIGLTSDKEYSNEDGGVSVSSSNRGYFSFLIILISFVE